MSDENVVSGPFGGLSPEEAGKRSGQVRAAKAAAERAVRERTAEAIKQLWREENPEAHGRLYDTLYDLATRDGDPDQLKAVNSLLDRLEGRPHAQKPPEKEDESADTDTRAEDQIAAVRAALNRD